MSQSACAIGKDYAPASFKGVPFYCTDADIEGGRRGAEGEFPFGEHTAYADLGRKIRVYHLTAKFREDDHVLDSAALFAVCELPGPGVLVHPTRGAVTVACRSIKVKDQIEEAAGETVAELEFVEANMLGSLGFGFIGSLFGVASSALMAQSQTSFLANYAPVQTAPPFRTDIVNTAQQQVFNVASAYEQVLDEQSPTTAWRSLLKMEEVIRDDGLAVDPVLVDNALTGGMFGISVEAPDPTRKFNIFRKIANAAVGSSDLPDGVAKTSEEAVHTHTRIIAGVNMADAAAAQTYDTVADALAALDMVTVVLADETRIAYANCDNGLYLALRAYTAEVTKLLNSRAYQSPATIAVDFGGGVYPLVAAYVIYGDAKRHRELEKKNVSATADGRFV